MIPAYIIVMLLFGEKTEYYVWIWVVIAYVFGLIDIICVGLPTQFILSKFNMKNALPYIIIGFVFPAVFVWFSHPFGQDRIYMITWQGILLGGFGAMCALIFWKYCRHETT